jgi:hypothetical protein
VDRAGSGAEGKRTGTDDAIIPLRDTRIVIEHGGRTLRFRVHSASVSLADPSRRPIHVRFEGPQGSATIELPRTVAWRLTADVHDMTIAARRKTTKRRPGL